MIRFEHVRKEYQDTTPLKDVCGELEEGKIYTIIGPSGAGKSTLLRMINGLGKPTSGKLFYNDLEISGEDTNLTEVRKHIGMVFQHFNLFNHLSVKDNLVIPQMDVLGRSEAEAIVKARALLAKVGLERTLKKRPAMISGGQKQRVAIARALAMDPEVILFDEPTSALDPNMTNEVKNIILSLKEEHKTMIIVTHDMEFAEQISDEVLYLDEGVIYERGTPQQIFHDPQKPRTIIFIEQMKMLEITVRSDELDYDQVVSTINEYCSQLKVSFASYNNMVAVMEELVVEKLCHQREVRKIRFVSAYHGDEKCMYYAVQYSGNRFDPFKEDNYSIKILNNIVDDVTYTYFEEREYNNVLRFKAKMS